MFLELVFIKELLLGEFQNIFFPKKFNQSKSSYTNFQMSIWMIIWINIYYVLKFSSKYKEVLILTLPMSCEKNKGSNVWCKEKKKKKTEVGPEDHSFTRETKRAFIGEINI